MWMKQKDEPIRVAQIMGKLWAGGVEMVVFNYYRAIDKSKIQFDFYYDADSTVEPPQNLIDMGARFYKIPPYQKLPQYIRELKKHLKENQYLIVHSHLNTLSVFPLYQCLKTVESAEAIKNLSYNIHVFDELEPTAVWGKLYKKSAVQNLRFNEKMNVGEDFVFNYFAICKAKVVTYCNLKLYNYNFVETSLMNNKIYSPKLMRSFEELVKFAESQKNSEYFDEVIVRSVNVAFTIYLKTPEKQSIEKNEIEEYIVKYRSSVLTNTKTNLKIRVALVLSTISFKLVRWVFFKTKKLQIS